MTSIPSLGFFVVVSPELATAARAAGLDSSPSASLDVYPWTGGTGGDLDAEHVARYAAGKGVIVASRECDRGHAERLANDVACRLGRAVYLVIVGAVVDFVRLAATGADALLAEAEKIDPHAVPDARPPTLDLAAALPSELAGASQAIADWIQIAPEAVVTCLLAHASAAIGNARWVAVRGFAVPLSLHYVTSLPIGSGKSEIRRYLRRATADIESKVHARREDAGRQAQKYVDEIEEWRSARKSATGRATAGPRPEPPPPSPLGGARVTYTLSEANMEGVVETLLDTPRGLLWTTDEAHEIVGMLGAYGAGRRSLDAARLRKLTESQPVEVHRARSNVSPLRRLRRPWLALDLDVQPGVLRNLFAAEDRVSGLTARLLTHEPRALQGARHYVTPQPEPGDGVLRLLSTTLGALFALPLELDEDGTPRPTWLPLASDAEREWAGELERMEAQYVGASEERVGALGHARGRLLRLAGVLALLRNPGAGRVEEADMGRAIVHIRYHLAHAERLAEREAETAEDREGRELDEFVEREGEPTARHVGRYLARFKEGGTSAAKAALDRRVELGTIERLPGPRTTRYRRAPRGSTDSTDTDSFPLSEVARATSVGVGGIDGEAGSAGDATPAPRRKRWEAGA